MEKIIEQDLEPIAPEQDKSIPLDDLDLEGVIDGEEGVEGAEGQDYQFTLKIKQDDNESDSNIEPTFTFVLTPKEAEGEEAEDDLEQIEDTGEAIEQAQAPEASVAAPAAPLPESVQSDLIPIKEQEGTPIMPQGEPVPTTPPAEMAPEATEPPLEEEPELEEDAGTELSEEDLKGFIEGAEIEVKFKIDDETEFNLDEAVDYLKLYPESEIFVVVTGDVGEFQEKLDEFMSGKDEAVAEVETEDQNVMVANDGDSLDLKNTPQANPATPEVSRESFAIFNLRGKKNLPDGIYIAHLAENKLYGRIDVSLTENKLVIGKDVFALNNKLNIAESREKESIELSLKESETEKLLALLKDKADITVKL